ncbi:MAG: APC family permease [Parvimonas sp.]|uniref:APC family permease n=1 Tax=Parvimonas sp. TaxID=1944660 RepID=UPI0025DCBAB1|nr:APC family permease [Parvimonas sp.]MCI5996959.1 APC family permease [Parvimonas sp.]
MNKKKIGFWSIVLLTINSIIGTGIFLSPGSVAKSAGTQAPMIYLVAAVFTSVLAITFASAAKYVTKSGAAYAYVKAAFGNTLGQYVGVTRVIAASIAWGTMGTFVVRTTLKIFGFDSANLTYVTVGFLVLMSILLLINIFGTRLLTVISDISTIGKVLALLVTIFAGIAILVYTGKSNISDINLLKAADGSPLIKEMSATAFVTAVIAAFYAFTGFESVASGSQDMENPEKNLPKAIPLAIGIIAAIYFGIVLVGMHVNPVALVQSKEVVVLASIFTNPILEKVVVLGALVSMFGINVAASFHTPRVLEAMAKEKQVPEIFAKRMSNDLPLPAFLFTAFFAIIIPLSFRYDSTGIAIISSISRFVQFLIVPLAVVVFYYGKSKETILDSKKSVVTDVIIPILALIFSVLLLVKFDWKGQFSIKDASGAVVTNTKAIISMIVGYVVLPVIMFVYTKMRKENR